MSSIIKNVYKIITSNWKHHVHYPWNLDKVVQDKFYSILNLKNLKQ